LRTTGNKLSFAGAVRGGEEQERIIISEPLLPSYMKMAEKEDSKGGKGARKTKAKEPKVGMKNDKKSDVSKTTKKTRVEKISKVFSVSSKDDKNLVKKMQQRLKKLGVLRVKIGNFQKVQFKRLEQLMSSFEELTQE
jgi:hypothetical protein